MKQNSKIKCCTPQQVTIPGIDFIETAPTSSGNSFLLKYLQGGELTRDQAIRAKCADCCGYYVDGRMDCEVPTCPLYPFSPYRKKGAEALN